MKGEIHLLGMKLSLRSPCPNLLGLWVKVGVLPVHQENIQMRGGQLLLKFTFILSRMAAAELV